jgi:hypothetical protein
LSNALHRGYDMSLFAALSCGEQTMSQVASRSCPVCQERWPERVNLDSGMGVPNPIRCHQCGTHLPRSRVPQAVTARRASSCKSLRPRAYPRPKPLRTPQHTSVISASLILARHAVVRLNRPPPRNPTNSRACTCTRIRHMEACTCTHTHTHTNTDTNTDTHTDTYRRSR